MPVAVGEAYLEENGLQLYRVEDEELLHSGTGRPRMLEQFWRMRLAQNLEQFDAAMEKGRRILILIYSADAQNWFQAGFIAMSRRMLDAFSYASNLTDGDDLLVLSPTSVNAYNQHNGT